MACFRCPGKAPQPVEWRRRFARRDFCTFGHTAALRNTSPGIQIPARKYISGECVIFPVDENQAGISGVYAGSLKPHPGQCTNRQRGGGRARGRDGRNASCRQAELRGCLLGGIQGFSTANSDNNLALRSCAWALILATLAGLDSP